MKKAKPQLAEPPSAISLHFKNFARIVVLAVLLFQICTGLAIARDALDRQITVNIPENTQLDEALIEWGVAAKMTVMINTTMVDHQVTHGLRGTLRAGTALSALLRNSGLAYTAEGDRIRIVPEPIIRRTAGRSDNSATTLSTSSSDSAGGAPDLAEVVVTSYKYLSVDTSGTTNLPLPIEKVPQSISLVSDDFIKAADLKTLGEIAEYTPGAVNEGDALGFGSNILLRGFVPGRAVDGINVLTGTGNFFEPDYLIFDRLEVVKGPSSVVYGVSSPGGLVNFVTKSATPQTVNFVTAQFGSWNNYRVEAQGATALDADGRVRVIGIAVRDQGDSFMDVINHAKTSLYGGLNADLADSITAYIHGGFEKFERTAFDGIPAESDGSPAPVSRSFFIGSRDMKISTSVYHVEGDVTWHITEMLDVDVKGNLQNSNTTGVTPYSYGLDANGGLGIAVQTLHKTESDNYGIGLSSIYRFDALGLKNSFLSLGVLRQDGRTNLDWGTYGYPTVSIFSGEAAISSAFESLLSTGIVSPFTSDTHALTTTVSAQSVLQILSPLSVLLGVSYSKPDETLTTGGIFTDYSIKGQVSGRAGLTYEFLSGFNAYVSYSQSFSPQIGLTYNSGLVSVLPPLSGDQYEVGLKYKSIDSRILLTGSVFQIKEKNVPNGSAFVDGVNYSIAAGEVTHKGLELGALGQISRQWQVNAGYSYLDPKFATASAALGATAGETEAFVPKQTASVYTAYTLQRGALRGVSLGGGARYVGSQQTSFDASTRNFPSYVLVDATASYTVDKWLVQLNARNIFNKFYLVNNYQSLLFGNSVGAPLDLALSVRREF